MKKILFIAIAAVALVACGDSEKPLDPKQKADRDNLIACTASGIYSGSAAILNYSEANHQLYCGVQQLTSRIMNQTTSQYAQVKFETKPILNKDVKASVVISAGLGEDKDFTATFRVLKIYGDLIYIWSDDERFGAVMYWKL